MSKQRLSFLADFLLLFVLAAILVAPVFKLKYGLYTWSSIESTFISDARFIMDHGPNPIWQPLWYMGTRFDYVYPPALRYGTAGVAKLLGVIPSKGYHIYVAFFYCFGIAGVYLFTRIASRSRSSGLLAAIATLLVSPAFLFMKDMRNDSIDHMPQRLWALMRYGEGPHITSLAWIGFALAFGWLALERWRPWCIVLAAISCAMVVSNNFYGATALAMFLPLAAWCLYIALDDFKVFYRAALICILGYGLTAMWLTPSFLKVTLRNMQFVSQPGNPWSIVIAAVSIAAFVAISHFKFRGRKECAYRLFVLSTLYFFCLNVLGQYFWNFRVIGEPLRLVPELDLAIILACVLGLQWLWDKPKMFPRIAAAAIVLICLGTSYNYLRHPWGLYAKDNAPFERVEYRIQDWIVKNIPNERVMAAGSIRIWLDAWNDIAQLGGGSDQGILNSASKTSQWEIVLGDKAEPSIAWMKLTGVDAVVVMDKTSQEEYHDYLFPEKFKGKLPVLFDDHKGNVIYRVPRRYPSLARVVDCAKLDALPMVMDNPTEDQRKAFLEVLENGPDAPTQTWWETTEVFHVKAHLEKNQCIIAQVSYDRPWYGQSGLKPVEVWMDRLGLIRINAWEGDHDIRVEFRLPIQNIIGRFITMLTLIAMLVLVAGRRFSNPPWWAIALALAAVSVTLNFPLTQMGESPYRASIEPGYAGMSKFFSQHPNPWGWDPFTYCGLAAQFLYLPLVHYAAIVAAWLLRIPAAYGYELVTGLATCLGPVTVFAMVFYFTRSRKWALIAAVTYLFFSPSYSMFPKIDKDRGVAQLPWRINAAVQYGEKPHNFGLTLMPLAVIALHAASVRRRYWYILVAAILLAAVTLTNWIAGMGLAMICIAMLLAQRGAADSYEFRVGRALGTAVLAYLLACFWLTPSFVGTVMFNWPKDSYNFKLQVLQWVGMGVWLAGIYATYYYLRQSGWNFYRRFVTLCFAMFGGLMVTFYWLGVHAIPESHRYLCEFDLFAVLAGWEWFRIARESGNLKLRKRAAIACAVIFLWGSTQPYKYLTQGWENWRPVAAEITPEYRVARWLESQHPQGRVMASGGVRYRLNNLTDLEQIGGTFETGLRNRTPVHYDYQIRTSIGSEDGYQGADALLQLKAMGVQYVVINGPGSQEFYRDYVHPYKFDELLEKVYADRGDMVYRVPFKSYANLIRPDEIPRYARPPKQIGAYVAAIEDYNRPQLTTKWVNVNQLEIKGSVEKDMLVAVRVSWAPGWEAVQDGTPVQLSPDVLGFMMVKARPAENSTIELRFNGSTEQKTMAGVSGLAWLLALGYLLKSWRKGT
jgi:hypothetical protein